MAWFLLKDQDRRPLRKGIHLRIRNLPKKIIDMIVENLPDGGMYSGQYRDAQIEWVAIGEMQPEGKVLLEVWSSTHEERVRHSQSLKEKKVKPIRYTVFHLRVDEDPEWVCEANTGRGLVGQR